MREKATDKKTKVLVKKEKKSVVYLKTEQAKLTKNNSRNLCIISFWKLTSVNRVVPSLTTTTHQEQRMKNMGHKSMSLSWF